MNRLIKFLDAHQYITLAIIAVIVVAGMSFAGYDVGRMRQRDVEQQAPAHVDSNEMAAIRAQGYYTVSPTPVNTETVWYAARVDHSDCIVSGISPGAIIAHYNQEGDHVDVVDRDGQITVSVGSQEFYFFQDYQTCVSARIIPAQELAKKYR